MAVDQQIMEDPRTANALNEFAPMTNAVTDPLEKPNFN